MSTEIESFKYLIDLGLEFQDQSSFYWNFLVVGQIALVGWVLEKGSTFKYLHRVIIAFVFLLFLAMNLWGLTTSNIQKDITLSSVKVMAEKNSVTKAFPDEFIQAIKKIKPSYWYPYKFWLIWFPSNLVVLLLILWPARGEKLNKHSQSER